jgi:hypothetical protein
MQASSKISELAGITVQLAVLTKAQTFVGFRNKGIEFCLIFSFQAEIKMCASFSSKKSMPNIPCMSNFAITNSYSN